MRILGMDQSLANFGFYDEKDGLVQYMDTFHSKKMGVERLLDIENKIEMVYDNGKPYDVILIEGYSFGSRGQAVFSIAELGGLIRVFFYKKGVNLMVVPPTSLKKFVTGKGVAPKEIMLKEVFRKWKFDTSDHNLADAYALAKFGEAFLLISQGKIENYTKSEIEVIKNWQKSKKSVETVNEP